MAFSRHYHASSMSIHLIGVLLLLSRSTFAFISPHGRPPCRAPHYATSTRHYDDFLPSPHVDLQANQVVEACLDTMMQQKDAGLEVCWNFSSDRCRASLGGSLEAFRDYASNPVFSYLVNCHDYKTLSIGPLIPGTPTRGVMQTVLVDVIHGDGTARQFLWTLQRERRPPRQNCFLVHECIYVRNAYDLTL